MGGSGCCGYCGRTAADPIMGRVPALDAETAVAAPLIVPTGYVSRSSNMLCRIENMNENEVPLKKGCS